MEFRSKLARTGSSLTVWLLGFTGHSIKVVDEEDIDDSPASDDVRLMDGMVGGGSTGLAYEVDGE